jgi:hypothetical protein
MNAENSTADEDARAVALELLREGEATVSDAARLAGVDRQLVHYWAKAAGIDPNAARDTRLARQWRARMAKRKGTATKRKATKAELREQGDRAVAAFNKKQQSRKKRV